MVNQTSQSSNILCQNCTENQQKIVQLLHSFDINASRSQYEDYSQKLDKRYPLCATCSFKVQVQLKKCEEEASLNGRRQTARSGEDWQNKLKLAQKMKWTHFKRKVLKEIFFWPDFTFQLLLIFKCILKSQIEEEEEENSQNIQIYSFNFVDGKDLKIWAPNKFTFSSSFFIFPLILFCIQFHGIAFVKPSSFSKIFPQLFLIISRFFIGNFLYRCDKSVLDFNSVLVLAAVGLAIIYKTGSKNVPFNSFKPVKTDKFILNKELRIKDSPEPAGTKMIFSRSDKRGFASYSDTQHAFHSFANQVPENVPKPIMPWPDRPLPSKAFNNQNDMFLKFNENLNIMNNAVNYNNFKMRPTKLDVYDPLELEPMFSSFSLSDEPEKSNPTKPPVSRRRVINPTVTATLIETKKANINGTNPAMSPRFWPVINQDLFNIFYNCLLTLALSIFRISLLNSSLSLVTIILALTFGLRGFIWPRLSLRTQLLVLFVAIGRLAWLGAEINEKIPFISNGLVFKYLALSLDLILIILR